MNESTADLHPVIIDTDANNELDDQHALAYALERGDWEVNLRGGYIHAYRVVDEGFPGSGAFEYQVYVVGVGGTMRI